jgi:3D (Asp-Asp-Asp) domain-containing protein/septal ring factor EnvC (AmiA/AmiB activator)
VARGAGRNGRLVTIATAGALAAAFLLAQPGFGAADGRRAPSHALRTRQAALDRAEQRAVLDLYAFESRLAGARNVLADLQARAARLAAEHARLRRQTAAVRQSLSVAHRRLARALRSLYEHGQPDPVAILLGAGSLDEAVAGIDDLRRTAESNRRLVAQLQRTSRRLRVMEARLREHRQALEIGRRNAEQAVAGLSRATHDKAAAVTSIRSRLNLTRRQIGRLDGLARTAQRRSATVTARRAAPLAPQSQEARAAPSPAQLPPPGTTRTLVVDAVAYHLPGHTASGLPVGVGVVAVDPSVIPLGTRMFVPGYGNAVAADVGSAVRGSLIDLWMPSRAGALAWGRHTVTITLYG